MNIVLGSNYESIVSETKRLANKTTDLKSKLSKIRTSLDDAYDGQIDYNSEIKALEKRLYTQQTRMSNLSSAINGAFDELVGVDAQKIEIDNNLKVALGKESINTIAGFGVSSNSMLSIISKYQSELWKKIIPVSGIVIPGVSQILQKLKELIENILNQPTGSGSSGTISDTAKDTVDQFGEVVRKEEEKQKQAELERMIKNNERIDTTQFDDILNYTDSEGKAKGFYKTSNGCTWYAISRYRQVNGIENDLKFSEKGGDANNWIYSIDKNNFQVDSTNVSTENLQDVIKTNAIAVSTENDSRKDLPYDYKASAKHVAYVELVKDGYVYYTQGSYGEAESTYGYVHKVTIEQFAIDYEYIISAK